MIFFWRKKATGASTAKKRLKFILRSNTNTNNLYILNHIKSDVSDLLRRHIDIKSIKVDKDSVKNDLYNLSIEIKENKKH